MKKLYRAARKMIEKGVWTTPCGDWSIISNADHNYDGKQIGFYYFIYHHPCDTRDNWKEFEYEVEFGNLFPEHSDSARLKRGKSTCILCEIRVPDEVQGVLRLLEWNEVIK